MKKYNVLNRKIESNVYSVKIDSFEGPLDLLCYLVKTNKMDIYDINISKLTEEYISYIYKMKELNLDIASEFIVMTSRLLLIKSKKMLPKNNDDVVEEETELLESIIKYSMYKKAAKYLAKRYNKYNYRIANSNYTFKMSKKEFNPVQDKENEKYNGKMLKSIYLDVIQRYKEKENIKKDDIQKIAIRERVSVKSKIRQILNIFKRKLSFGFNNTFAKETKMDNIAAFLAILEMSNKDVVKLKQDGLFEEIFVKKVVDKKEYELGEKAENKKQK